MKKLSLYQVLLSSFSATQIDKAIKCYLKNTKKRKYFDLLRQSDSKKFETEVKEYVNTLLTQGV